MKETKEERIARYLAKMEKARGENDGDWEYLHSEYDAVLCELLRELGYGRVVDIWNDTPKWYA